MTTETQRSIAMSHVVPIPPDFFPRLERFGVDATAVRHRAGIAPETTTFTTASHMAFWRAVAELSPRRDIGLRLGSDKSVDQLNLAELAALHAPTFGEALRRIARYKRLVCAEEVAIVRRGDEVKVGFHWPHAEPPLPHLLTECVFAAVVSLVRYASGERFVPRRVELSRRKADARLFEKHFDCPVVFDAPSDRLVVAAADLDRRFLPRDSERYRRLVPGLEAAVAKRSPTFTDEVRAAMRTSLVGEQVTITKVARGLARTPRTLQRHLVREGTTYQALLDEVRHETAQRLLQSTDLQEGEIAFFLGFAELNSFTRAFRGWEGVTPRRFRERE